MAVPKESLETAENRPGSFSAQLLVNDGMDQRMERRQAPRNKVDGADPVDHATESRVGLLQSQDCLLADQMIR